MIQGITEGFSHKRKLLLETLEIVGSSESGSQFHADSAID